ncbi:MAG: histidine phosphatase family protein [Rhodocyclales bacterium]|nr:histidine phosphatase family protein [Rhodocyclales bacterium]
MTTIYLLRHGALAGDNRERFIGQTDLPLAPEGIRQAETMATALAGRGIGAIHCSDLTRSRQTAGIVGKAVGVTPAAHPELREVSLGDWEGLLRREVAERWADEFAARGRDMDSYRPPGGESFADCLARAWPLWKTITQTDAAAIAVVAHAGVNRLLLCRLLGMPVQNMFRLGQDYGCINIVELDRRNVRLRLLNGRSENLNN